MTTMALARLELHLDVCSGTSRAGLPQAGLSWEEVNWRVVSIEKRGRRKGNSLASHCGASRMQALPRLLKDRFLEPSYQCSRRGFLSDKHTCLEEAVRYIPTWKMRCRKGQAGGRLFL